jgi:hypothetical protein
MNSNAHEVADNEVRSNTDIIEILLISVFITIIIFSAVILLG